MTHAEILLTGIRALGCELAVAEYVETPAILQSVTEPGVDCAQGYHFGRPQPAESMLPLKPG